MNIRAYSRLVTWLLAIAATLFLFFLSATWAHFEWKTNRESSNYWHLSDGFLQGQLHLPVDPDPVLLKLENPFSRFERRKIPYMWDASLYKGRYYLYFGPVPALVAYIPFKLFFGFYPSDNFVIFSCSLLAGSLLYLACRLVSQRLTRTPPPGPEPLWFLYIVFASSLPLQLGGGMYVVAATCAMLFQVIAIISLLMLMTNESRRSWWAIAAGLAIVGAVGSRPTHILLVPIAVLALGFLRFRYSPREISNKHCAAFIAPLLVGGFLLAAYNYLRFDDPAEFGIRYQLGGADLRDRPLCSVQRVLEQPNLLKVQAWYLLLQPPTLISRFPYLSFSHIPLGKLDPSVYGYLAHDAITGFFVFSPLMLPALAATAAYWRRFGKSTRIFQSVCIVSGAASLGYHHTCFGVAARYLFEAVVPLTIACVPMLWVACSEARYRVSRAAWRVITVIGLSAGILMGALGSLDGHFQKGSFTAYVFEGIENKTRNVLGIPREP